MAEDALDTTSLTSESDLSDVFEGSPKRMSIALPSALVENEVGIHDVAEEAEATTNESSRINEIIKHPLLCWFDELKLKNDNDKKETDEIVEAEPTSGMLPEVRLSKLRINAEKYARRGESEEAVNEKIRAVALVRIIYGDLHLQRARSYAELAEGYLKLRKLPLQAMKHAENARDILLDIESTRLNESNGAENRVETASVLELIYFTMGKANKMLKNMKKADNLLQKAYLVSKKKTEDSGSSLRDTYKSIEILTLLGEVARLRKQNGQAMEWFEKAIEMAEEKFGNDSGEIIPLYHQLGKTELQLGKNANFDKVFESYGKARTVAASSYGKTSLEYATSCALLAKAYVESEDRIFTSSAETAFEEAIMVYASVLGKDHRKTLEIEERLCKLMLQSAKYNEAEKRIKMLIGGKKRRFGDISEQVADSYKMLGGLYLSQNKFKLAMTKLLKALEIYQVVLGSQNSKTKSLSKVIQSIKKSPATNDLNIPQEKLKDRPRFTNTVSGTKQFGFSKPLM